MFTDSAYKSREHVALLKQRGIKNRGLHREAHLWDAQTYLWYVSGTLHGTGQKSGSGQKVGWLRKALSTYHESNFCSYRPEMD